MKVGDMNFEHVWLGKAIKPAPGDGGTVFELLGRTRAGGYYRIALPMVSEEEPIKEMIGLGLLQYWFREHGYDLPWWVEEELRESGNAFAKAGWNPELEEYKVQKAKAEVLEKKRERSELLMEHELLLLEIEFLKILRRPW